MPEDSEKQRKRLLFRSHHTGMKENDLFFGAFADRHLGSLSDAEVAWLEWLLMDHNDIDLHNWVTGREPVPPELDHPVMRRLREFRFQPD